MMKKTIGLLAALTITLTSMGAMAADAEGYEENGELSASYAADDNQTDIYAGGTGADRDAMAQHAIETQDPQYFKAMQAQAAFEMNAGGGSDDQNTEGENNGSGSGSSDAEEEDYEEALVLDSTKSYCKYTGQTLSHASRFDNATKSIGIDVSQWQYNIDWNSVKADGIDFAIIRLGYSGYGDGTSYVDDYFYTNIQNAKRAGIKVGIYYYTQATTASEAKREANYVLSMLDGMALDLPVYYDLEFAFNSSGQVCGRLYNAGLSKTQMANICKAFCSTIEASGYKSKVYTYYNFFYQNLDFSQLGAYAPFWLACYDNYTDFDGDYNIWQFASTGKVDGISTNVDMNVLYGGYTYSQGTGTSPDNPDNPVIDEPTAKTELGKPENLDYDKTASGYTLYWDEVEGAEGYEIAYYNFSKEKYVAVTTATGDSCDLSGVKEDKPYSVRAYATSNGTKYYGPYSEEIYFGNSVIKGLKATLDGRNVNLTWVDDEDCDGYYVYRSTDGKNFTKIGNTEFNRYTDEGISEDQSKYYYLVQSYTYNYNDEIETGIRSNPVTVLLAPAKPAAPSLKTCTNNSVTVTWSGVEDADGYQVLLYNANTGNYSLKADVAAGSELKATIEGLSAGNSYKIAVRAYSTSSGAKKFGDASEPLTAKTIPNAVTNIKSKSTGTGIMVSWTASPGAEQYVIYKKTATGYTKLGTTKSTQVEIKITGTGAKAYCVTAAITQNGAMFQSAYSEIITANGGSSSDTGTANGIGTPSFTGASYSNVNGNLTLSWSEAARATGYRLYMYDSNAKTYKTVKTLNGSTKTSYTIKNVAAGKTLKFKVKAYRRDSSGLKWGKASSVYKVNTSTGTVLPAPTNLYATATPTSIKLTWSSVNGATSYNVYEVKSTGYKIVGQTKSTSYTIASGAGSGRTFAVSANNGTTAGNYSANSVVNALPSAPNLYVVSNSSSTIKLGWTFPSNATGARLYMYNSNKKKYVSVKTLSAKKTALTIKNLNAGSAYKFKIKAYIKSGTGITWSKASSVFTAYTTT